MMKEYLMQDTQQDECNLSVTSGGKLRLEEEIQQQNDAEENIREAARPERMRLLTNKSQLGRGDWIEIFGISREKYYEISAEGVQFNGWNEADIELRPRNNLDPAIDKAIKLAGSLECADVYLKLKELALNGESPFTGLIDGDALCYTNIHDVADKLTKNALTKRLGRRAAAQ